MRWTVVIASVVLGVGAYLLLGRASAPAGSEVALPPQLLSRVVHATDVEAIVELRCENEIGCSGRIEMMQDDEWLSTTTRYSMEFGESRRQKVPVELAPDDPRAMVWWREDSGMGSFADVTLRHE